jgi:hypothetical protein
LTAGVTVAAGLPDTIGGLIGIRKLW